MSDSTDHAHEHHRFQAHHFDTPEQQFQAGKLGMWLFLATEVLFFSGMFCAYAVFRAAHPEVFEDAAHFLNYILGGANTVVLLLSSFTVAWAVRCAQLNHQLGLLVNLLVTLACAGIFMGVKAVEYSLKFTEGLYWRGDFSYTKGSHPDLTGTHEGLQTLGLIFLGVGVALVVLGTVVQSIGKRWALYALAVTVLGACGGCLVGNVYTALYEEQQHAAAEHDEHASHEEHNVDDHPSGEALLDEAQHSSEAGHADEDAHTDEGDSEEGDSEEGETAETPADGAVADAEALAEIPPAEEIEVEYDGEGPKFLGVFFSIYYTMTGVHAIHILAGIGVFVWIVSRAARGHFEPEYYGPVEYTGLYWHLVDLIWIYLFPLLYLIQ